MNRFFAISMLIGIIFSAVIYADIPVVDGSAVNVNNHSQNLAPPQQMVTMDQGGSQFNVRLNRLEQQMNYLQQMNLVSTIAQLQQAIQDLRGIVETQGHALKQLETQQRNLYKDLNDRLDKLSSGHANITSQATNVINQPEVAPSTFSLSNVASNLAHGSTQKMVHAGVDTVSATTVANTKKASEAHHQEMQVYEFAFNLIKSKKYSQAIDSFQSYLKKYPTGKYAANANYWLGELYAISGDNQKAVESFNAVINDFGDSPKVPDAMLKLGSMASDRSDFQQAKLWWGKLIKQYANTPAARIAANSLRALQKAGR